MIFSGVDVFESIEDFFVSIEANGTEEGGSGNFSFSIDLDGDDVIFASFELEPRTTGGADLGCKKKAAGSGLDGSGEENAGRASQLTHHNPLDTVDNERAAISHEREVAEEDFLLHIFTGFFI